MASIVRQRRILSQSAYSTCLILGILCCSPPFLAVESRPIILNPVLLSGEPREPSRLAAETSRASRSRDAVTGHSPQMLRIRFKFCRGGQNICFSSTISSNVTEQRGCSSIPNLAPSNVDPSGQRSAKLSARNASLCIPNHEHPQSLFTRGDFC